MFDNIGERIKGLAIVLNIIGTIAAIIIGLLLLTNQKPLFVSGFLVIVLGCILVWMSAYLLYGFGQLIQNTDFLVRNINNEKRKTTQKELSNTSQNILYVSRNKLSDATLNGITSKCDICKNDYLVTYDADIHKTTGLEQGKVCNKCVNKFKKIKAD